MPDIAGPPLGATVTDDGVTFRVWAPRCTALAVVIGTGAEEREVACAPDPASGPGYFVAHDAQARAGDTYQFQVGVERLPDPASRFQPDGVFGRSLIVDPRRYAWQAHGWRRPALCGRVIYELHLGTFTPAGTFRAARERLDYLADLGVNTVQLMPLADFPGRWNWGYDGVMSFAPARCYGTPDELRAFIDAAHLRRLAVVVDVVYNHLGPIGNVLPQYSDDYLHRDRESGWGATLNFDGPHSRPVRHYFLRNALMWLEEYRVDGLRLDATHAIHDASASHLVAEVAAATSSRGAFTIAEDERNEARVITPREAGGWGVDGVWADDFHHVLRVGLTGVRTSYFAHYAGSQAELVATLRDGWLFHGQPSPATQRPRGTPGARLPAHRFVFCISNHDQVGNRPRGDRLHEAIPPAHYRAVSLLLCLVPYTPMLFQGQEWGARTPFPFFTDLPGEIGQNMAAARRAEFQRPGVGFAAADIAAMPDPQADTTFHGAKLDWSELEHPPHTGLLALYREALRIRADHPVFQSCERSSWNVSPWGTQGAMIRWRHPDGAWSLTFSLEPGTRLEPPGEGGPWQQVLSSNEARFGGESSGATVGPAAVLWRGVSGIR